MRPSFAAAVVALLGASLCSACGGLDAPVRPVGNGRPAATTPPADSTSLIAAGLRQALDKGAEVAVGSLGRPGGFLDTPRVRIGLPSSLDKVAQTARALGQGAKVDAFEASMNRAAEAAVPASLEIIRSAIQSMTLSDARGILNGGDTAATDYLRRVGGSDIQARMLPIVSRATQSAEVTRYHKNLTANIGTLGGLVGVAPVDLDQYITGKATDGLFTLIAEEERKIRRDPVARTTDLLRQVFGQR